MTKRTVIGLALIALMCGLLWADWRLEQAGWPRLPVSPAGDTAPLRGLPLAALLTLLVAAGYLELARLSVRAGVPVFRFTGLVATILICTLPFWRQGMDLGRHEGNLTVLVLGVTVLAMFADQLIHYRTEHAIRQVGVSLLAVCYLGACGAAVLGIRLRFGVGAFAFFLTAVKVTDIGAFFAGSFFGRRKLIPWLSAGKTWEGLVGGLALAGACGVGMAWAMRALSSGAGQFSLSLWAGGAIAVAMGLVGQLADLCESAMKRDAGRKDSGAALPEFGGVLDIIDSPLLAAPVAYVLLAMTQQG